MKCTKGLEIEVMCSTAYYLGTRADEGWPNCRCSGYFESEIDARDYLNSGNFVPRKCSENDFCNGGKRCISK